MSNIPPVGALVLVLFASADVVAQNPDEKPLTTIRAVRELSPLQAAQRRPVRLAGVVRHASPHVGDFFIQDETSPIYVQPCGQRELSAGDHVEVTGFSDAGGFAP